MSDKGGDDFDTSMSAIEEATRARVELAENAVIDQAAEEAPVEHVYKAPSRLRIVIMTVVGSLLGACFIFAVVFFAMRLGTSNFFKDLQKQSDTPTVNEVYLLSYTHETYLYGLSGKTPKAEGSYLLEAYGVKDNSDSAVITRMTQLEKLQASYNLLVGNEETNFAEQLGVDNAFFDSGSVIAVAIEDPYIASLQPTKLSRDESYGLEIKMLRTNLSQENYEETPPLAGYLNLIKVDNVQPREVTLYIDNN